MANYLHYKISIKRTKPQKKEMNMKRKVIIFALILLNIGALRAQDQTVNGKLTVNGDGKIGTLNKRHYLHIASKEWPEVRFQTPISDRQIRLGVAHADNTHHGVGEGDFYVYSSTSGTMPLIVNKDGNTYLNHKNGRVGIGTDDPISLLDVDGDGKIGSLADRHYLRIASKEWPEVRFQTPTSDCQIRLGVAHADNTHHGIGEGDFYVYSATSGTMPLIVKKNGNVSMNLKKGNIGIGTDDTKGYKLAVAGKMIAEQVTVDLQANWPDYVFEKDYAIPSLQEVEKHIELNGHLKDIPTAEDVKKNGISLGEMNIKLLQKIEELTLYTIAQEKKINKLEKENNSLHTLENKFELLQAEIEKLKSTK